MTSTPAPPPAIAPSILIVEDEPLVRDVTGMEFEDAGFTVFAADNGEAALALLAANPHIDVLFTDISLRNSIDGWEIAVRARRLCPDIAVCYATGYSSDPLKIVENGQFFKKPYLPTQIIAAVNRMLSR